jgi:hypothetical protein
MSDFSALLTDIDGVLADEETNLAKAMAPDADDAADDAKIKAAADGDADDDGEPDGDDATDDYDHDEPDGDEDEEGPGDGDGDEPPLTKAFDVTLPDGTEAQAIDGDALIKSFTGQLQAMRTEHQQALTQIATALSRSTKLIKSLREQNQTLATQVTALGQSGRGRKSAITVHEKPMVGADPMAKAEGISPRELMAKALAAQQSGRLTGSQVAEIDAYAARGLAIPESLLAKLGG